MEKIEGDLTVNLFSLLRKTFSSAQIAEKQEKELATLRAEYEKVKRELVWAKLTIDAMKEQDTRHKETVKSDLAKAKGCLRGEYCRNCVHSTLVNYEFRQKCLCTYGECAHFKEKKVNGNEPT